MTEFRGFDLYADPGDAALADAKATGRISRVAAWLLGSPHAADWRLF